MSLRSDWLDTLADRPVVQARMGRLWDELERAGLDPLPYMPGGLGLHELAMAELRKANEKGLSDWGRVSLADTLGLMVARVIVGGG